MDKSMMELRPEPADSRGAALRDTLMTHVDRTTVPSGVLHQCIDHIDELTALNGAEAAPTVSQRRFEVLYATLAAGALEPGIRGIEELRLAAAELRGRDPDLIPVYLADFVYQYVRPRFWVRVKSYLASKDSTPFTIPDVSEALGTGQSFFASTMLESFSVDFEPLPERYFGLKARFVVPHGGYLSNRGVSVASLRFAFDGEAGPEVQVGDTVEHVFAAYGRHELGVTVTLSDGSTRTSRFYLDVAEPGPRTSLTADPDWSFVDNSVQPPVKGYAWVLKGLVNGQPRAKIEQPLILAEGFPGKLPFDMFWKIVNESNFATNIRKDGRDLIMLGFEDGTRAIQDNARIYVQCVERAIKEKANSEKMICGGGSMGGLIARFALCSIEKASGIGAHQTALYFSIDTPHQGANIASSAQAFLQMYSQDGKNGAGAVPYAKQISSVAAQQMLLRWIPPFSEWRPPREFPAWSKQRDTFVAALREVGWMPRGARCVGVANGRGDGVGNGVPAGVMASKWEKTVDFWVGLDSLPASEGQFVALRNKNVDKDNIWTWRTKGGQALDGAPGGTKNTWRLIHDQLPGLLKWNPHPSHCFVSTPSACAMDVVDPYTELDTEPKPRSDLAAYKFSSVNTEHVLVTPELASWLLAEFKNSDASLEDETSAC